MRRLAQRDQQLLGLAAIGDLDADEQVRHRRIGVAIVEFRHRALAEQFAERAKAAGTLGNGHGEHRLALLA